MATSKIGKIDDDAKNIIPSATAGAPVNYRDSWRIFRIMAEIVEGYDFLGKFTKEVTILGSARLPKNSKYYKVAEQLGALLGKNKFTVITGGGPGIMEAANKGAFKAGGGSVGLNIQLPNEQRTNPYVKDSVAFFYFFTRKVMLTTPGNAYVFFPGGFGTLDEFFEVVDYMEIGQMDRAPVVLVGREYWEPIVKFLRQHSLENLHSITTADINDWHIVDSAEDAYEVVKDVKDRPNLCSGDPNNPLCVSGADWRMFRIMAELVDGFEFLNIVQKDVTVLGTKSVLPGTKYYAAAYEVGKLLAKNNYMTLTGGGPGIMEATNKGAFEHGGKSIGFTMRFKSGQERVNNYLTSTIGFFFPFVRKLIITSPSDAFIFFPGGFGTMHQLFELLTLQETKKMNPLPIILYGKEFWQPLMEFIHTLHTKFGTISQMDEDLIKIVDSPEEIMQYLK